MKLPPKPAPVWNIPPNCPKQITPEHEIDAWGRACAEAMREECENLASVYKDKAALVIRYIKIEDSK